MRAMVTGATTPLGAAIVDHLLHERDVELVLAVGHEPDRPRGTPDGGDRLVYCRADLAHARAAHDLVWGPARELGIEVVVSAAQHRRAADRGRAVHAQNVGTVAHLLRACAGHPTIHRFVYRSFADVYALGRPASQLLDEEAPLELDPDAPQWVRDRVEADVTVCEHLAGPLEIVVLRCAEVFAPASGSQLWDYLSSRVCLRPLGFDPMIELLSLEDAAIATGAAVASAEVGVFNIAGFDRLPLSRAIEESIRLELPVPGPLIAPLYRMRRWLAGFDFRYDQNAHRFHLGGILDGTRARTKLGYVPHIPVTWPLPWWRRLMEQLGELRVQPGAG